MTTERRWMVAVELGVFALASTVSLVFRVWPPVALAAPVLGLAVWDWVRS